MQQLLVCRAGPVGSVLEDTVVRGYVERSADMVKPFNEAVSMPVLK